MTKVSFDILITDDKVLEDDEDFTVTIDPSDDYEVNDMSSTTVTIMNDDCKYLLHKVYQFFHSLVFKAKKTFLFMLFKRKSAVKNLMEAKLCVSELVLHNVHPW